MNNARLQEEVVEDKKEVILVGKETETIKYLQAIDELLETSAWKTLKEYFDPLTERLKHELESESMKKSLDVARINQLQGEIQWAKRYSNLETLKEFFKIQLTGIRIKLYAKKPDDGASISS